MKNCSVMVCRVWDDTDESNINDKLLEIKGIQRILTIDLQDWIHKFVINNIEDNINSNMKTADLKYVGWVEEIYSVDYKKLEATNK